MKASVFAKKKKKNAQMQSSTKYIYLIQIILSYSKNISLR